MRWRPTGARSPACWVTTERASKPTAALGVKQAGIVLRYIVQARERGLAVIFITHNPHHAYPVGDRFLILKRGRPRTRKEAEELGNVES